MFNWGIVLFVFFLFAVLFGFNGIAIVATSIAIILFYIFLALFISSIMDGFSSAGRILINKNK